MRIGHARAQIVNGQKFCARCDIDLPVVNFKPSLKSKSGLNSWCIECHKDYSKSKYESSGLPRGRPKSLNKKAKTVKIKEVFPEGFKRCSKCRIGLPVANFNPNPKLKSGLNSWCNECIKRNRPKYVPRGKPRRKMVKFDEVLPEGLRRCTTCKTVKEATGVFFCKDPRRKFGLSSDCKDCRSDYQKRNRDKDPEKRAEQQRRSGRKHAKKNKEKRKEWVKENRDKINGACRLKRKEDPMFRISSNIRRAVSGAIKTNSFKKGAKLAEYLGCNSQEFKAYLESLFQPGMTWDNYGWGNEKWNIDHRIPLAAASTVEDLYRLNHFTNLQPMWQPENFAKGDKMPSDV